MSLKAELEIWTKALAAFDSRHYDDAISCFEQIRDTSKILFNIGVILATKGEHPNAIRYFNEAVGLDQYLAIAYFQAGVSLFLMRDYEASLQQFEAASLFMRGNQDINYEQLGLRFRLYACEILFNIGLAKFYLGDRKGAMVDFKEASTIKVTNEHDVIDEALQSGGEKFTVFSIPVGVLFRPSEQKVKNMKPKDYLGKARLIAVSDSNDAFTTFTGSTRLKMGQSPVSRVRLPALDQGPHLDSDDRTEPARSKTTRWPRINTTELIRRAASSSSAPARPAPRFPTPANATPSHVRSDSRTSEDSPQVLSPPDAAPMHGLDGPSFQIDDLYEDYYADSNLDMPSGAAYSTNKAQTPLSNTRATAVPARTDTVRTVNSSDTALSATTKIRVKIRVDGDTRCMSTFSDMDLRDFLSRLAVKLDRPPYDLAVRFRDEDGDMISLRDEGDWEAAMDCARSRASANGEGKLEVWVE